MQNSPQSSRGGVAASSSSSNFSPDDRKRDTKLFVDETAAQEYSCCICHDVPSPVNAVDHKGCGTIFCGDCIEKATKTNKSCPHCRDPTDGQIRKVEKENKKVFQQMGKLKVRCDHFEDNGEGCNWQGDWVDLKSHLNNSCEFVKEECPLKCGNQFQRRELKDHQNQCPRRLLKCKHCADSIQAREMEHHLKEKCTKCETTIVKCPFSRIGCTAQVERCKLEDHVQSNTSTHLMMAVDRIDEQSKTISRIQLVNDALSLKQSDCLFDFGQEKTNSNPNLKKARELYEMAIEKGDPSAMTNLGNMFYNGEGVPKDFQRARELYEMAIEKGNSGAMTNLGNMFKKGEGVPKDLQRARELFEMAIEKGNSGAMKGLGAMFHNGQGVPKDLQRARELYEMAIEKGNSGAMTNLGVMFKKGEGVPKDFQRARELYEMAIEKGNSDAMNNLGNMFHNGEGVPKDFQRARELFEKAIEKGNSEAMNGLGVMFKKGEGVPKDLQRARELFERAAALGHEAAKKNFAKFPK